MITYAECGREDKGKKKFVAFVSLACGLLVSAVALAGWGSWTSPWVNRGVTYTEYWTPAAAGEHEIEFCANQNGSYYAGELKSYWGSTSNPGVYTLFNTSDVITTCRNITLYAGSSDIVFKFVFQNLDYDHDTSHQFVHRFFFDN